MSEKAGRAHKGAYGVVEEVMLFAVGLVIMLGLVTLFNSLESGMLSTLGNQRFEAINKYVASGAIMLHETGCTACYVAFPMPTVIGGETYTIGGSSQKKILVYSAANEKIFEENISAKAQGIIKSTTSLLNIHYDGASGEITLYGVSNY